MLCFTCGSDGNPTPEEIEKLDKEIAEGLKDGDRVRVNGHLTIPDGSQGQVRGKFMEGTGDYEWWWVAIGTLQDVSEDECREYE